MARLRHIFRRNDRQPGGGKNLSPEILIGAFHANNKRYRELHLFGRFDDSRADHIAFHYAAKDVYQDGAKIPIAQHKLERFGDLLGCRSATYIQEIGWFAAV